MKERIKIPDANNSIEVAGDSEGLEWRRPSNPSQPTSKPKFLPYLTKKPATAPKAYSRPLETTKSVPKFAQVASSSKEAILPPPRTATCDMAPILHLPLDIWHLITCQLHPSTISALTCTHPLLHNFLTPILYHSVDLSLSAPSTEFWPKTNISIMDHTWSRRSHIAKSQYLFIKQILAHPDLALHVRTLNWTIGLERMGLLPEEIQGEKPVWKDEEMYAVFEMLRDVVRLDVKTGTRSHGHLPLDMVGRGLFPNARYVKLSGIMRREFVDAVLSADMQTQSSDDARGKGKEKEMVGLENLSLDKVPLKTLNLDDLQEEGTFQNQATPYAFRRMSAKKRLLGTEVPQEVPRLGPCQPMQHILTPALYDRCRTLQRLSIRVYGMSERGSSDDELWMDWAVFIEEVKPQEVVFDCDRLPRSHGRGGGSALRFARLREARGRAAVANDRRFGETLLPVLRGGWEGLKLVEIRGVGESVVKELRVLEEKGVKVVFDVDNEESYKWLRTNEGN
ncbi:uncharacterized protein LY89DRAFT_740905 [Mollisia scopiformis]|uniref:Uncharacterized protein n=1 Tax=Mollisia scopiformis TaxID=149040 RepID=A0A132BBP0_MOLSC|nr:uncharacterized protein LY89DRAFT_740905 [Mollisia scopiformis]KUJ09840.1 hypothetical protein LY89DRAFT_740905 [Mollisia scopiformis]